MNIVSESIKVIDSIRSTESILWRIEDWLNEKPCKINCFSPSPYDGYSWIYPPGILYCNCFWELEGRFYSRDIGFKLCDRSFNFLESAIYACCLYDSGFHNIEAPIEMDEIFQIKQVLETQLDQLQFY